MKDDRCIICGEKKNGLSVREDYMIQAIRWFKKNVTKNERGYALVVCKSCYPKYAKARKKFENRQLLYLILGVVFAAVLVYASVDKPLAILYGMLVILFMFLLSLLTYMPELEVPIAAGGAKGPAEQEKAS